jgi:F0F1-type ATP synthase membrane subunit b/b'
MQNVREKFREELAERQNTACRDLSREEPSLQRALRDAVVEDVMKLFP